MRGIDADAVIVVFFMLILLCVVSSFPLMVIADAIIK